MDSLDEGQPERPQYDGDPGSGAAAGDEAVPGREREACGDLERQCVAHVLVGAHHVLHQPVAFGELGPGAKAYIAIGAVDDQLRAEPVADDADMRDQQGLQEHDSPRVPRKEWICRRMAARDQKGFATPRNAVTNSSRYTVQTHTR